MSLFLREDFFHSKIGFGTRGELPRLSRRRILELCVGAFLEPAQELREIGWLVALRQQDPMKYTVVVLLLGFNFSK
jgi:hypothetical protein